MFDVIRRTDGPTDGRTNDGRLSDGRTMDARYQTTGGRRTRCATPRRGAAAPRRRRPTHRPDVLVEIVSEYRVRRDDRVERGRPDAVVARADLLCDQLEGLLRGRLGDRDAIRLDQTPQLLQTL